MMSNEKNPEKPPEAKNHKYRKIRSKLPGLNTSSADAVHNPKQDEDGRDKVDRQVKVEGEVKVDHQCQQRSQSTKRSVEKEQLEKQRCWQPALCCQSTRMPEDAGCPRVSTKLRPAEVERARGATTQHCP